MVLGPLGAEQYVLVTNKALQDQMVGNHCWCLRSRQSSRTPPERLLGWCHCPYRRRLASCCNAEVGSAALQGIPPESSGHRRRRPGMAAVDCHI